MAGAGDTMRSSKLEYRANAPLVLESDRRGPREPSGEAVSLSGRLLVMGDRARARATSHR